MGKWLPEAREFVQYRMNLLNKIPVFVFTTGITLSDPTEHNLLKAGFAIDDISLFVSPVESGLTNKEISSIANPAFNRIESNRLSEPDRQIIRMAGIKDGDYLNPDEIRTWAAGICRKYLDDSA